MRSNLRIAPPQSPEDLWNCTVCTAWNEGDGDCRVCRVPRDREARPYTAEAPPERTPLRVVLPVLLLLVGAGAWAASLAPDASPWTAVTTRSGGSGEVRVLRQDELRLVFAETRDLASTLATTEGAEQDRAWTERLTGLRERWRVYGDVSRFPGLEAQESEAAALLEDLASLRFQRSRGLDGAPLRAAVDRLLVRLSHAEDSLPDGP